MVKIVDLFAGIGGIRLGFEQVFDNIECVFTSEIDKYAIKTYETNFGDKNIHGDITLIDANVIPDHDILLAGFPCQPFSQAGLKKGFHDPRGSLFFDIIRVLKTKKPKAFLLENVKQLKSHNNGETLDKILSYLKTIGYKNVQYSILKARDFGIPQNRERIYIVGFFDKTTKFMFPEPTNVETKLFSILDKNVNDKYTISDRLWQGHQRRKLANQKTGKGFGYSLFNGDAPYANTISARYYKDGSEILIEQIGKNPRKLTPREALRLQGFPESFVMPVSDVQAYKQLGNSVCVPVVRAIAQKMQKVMYSEL